MRKQRADISPAGEDAGLFRTAICDMVLELIPQMRRTDSDDLIVRGFVDRKNEIDIWFAGRRARLVAPLEQQLRALLSRARKTAEAKGAPAPEVDKLRLPIRALGAWRRTIVRDESGWETGTYHFVVARWSLLDADGSTVTFGEEPLVQRPQSSVAVPLKEAR